MGDRICVMRDGNIMQVADPLTLYRKPDKLFVAGFIGSLPMKALRESQAVLPYNQSACIRTCGNWCTDFRA